MFSGTRKAGSVFGECRFDQNLRIIKALVGQRERTAKYKNTLERDSIHQLQDS